MRDAERSPLGPPHQLLSPEETGAESHLLDGQEVREGDILDLFTEAGWVRGQVEGLAGRARFVPDSPPSLDPLPGNPLPLDAMWRWPRAAGEPGEGHGDGVGKLLSEAFGLPAAIAARISEGFPGGSIQRATAEDLEARGCPPPQAARIEASFALARRAWARERVREGRTVSGTREAVALLLEALHGHEQERMAVLHLDARLRVVSSRVAAIGTSDMVPVRLRDLFREAVRLNVGHILIGHNHPSGDPTPSEGDIGLTRAVAVGGGILGVSLVDHIIVGGDGYYSMAAAGLVG